MATGTLYFNDRDVESDFSLVVGALSGFPGMLGSAPRDLGLAEGPEIPGALLDPRLIRRKPGSASVKGIITTASAVLGLAALDNLRNTLLTAGEVAVRTCYATDRYCLAVCESVEGTAYQPEIINGNIAVSLSFQVKDGVAVRNQPDGYLLTTGRTACPLWSAESRPVIVIHGGGASLTNPVVTVRNAAGAIVQTMSFTVSLGANDALRIDCARSSVSRITAGVVSDALAAGYWPTGSGDFPTLRPYDGWVESAVYPTVELSASAGIAQGEITYSRRAA